LRYFKPIKSASLVGDSDKQRGLFWECIVGSPVSYSCFYLEDSILDMELTYLVMRSLAVLSSIFIFFGICFGFMGMSTTRIYENNNCKKLVWKTVWVIFIYFNKLFLEQRNFYLYERRHDLRRLQLVRAFRPQRTWSRWYGIRFWVC